MSGPEEADSPAAPDDPQAPSSETPPDAPSGGEPAVAAGTDDGRTVMPRWMQLALLPIALLAGWVLVRAAGKVIVMFLVAGIIALILNPLVTFLQRSGVRRGIAVLAVYLAFFLIVAGLGYALAHPIAHQAQVVGADAPHIVHEANRVVANFERSLNEAGFHVHFLSQGKTALQTLGDKLAKSSSVVAESAGEVLREAAAAFFDVVVVFVLSVYMLLYGDRIGRIVRLVVPGGRRGAAGTRSQLIQADDYPTLVQRAVSRYIGGQLLFSIVMGASVAVGLYIFGVLGIFPDGRKFALAFGIFYGFMELIPYIGPFLGAVPPVLVALFTKPITAVWVTLLFVGMQQLEGHVVAPQIFGRTLRLNPLLVLFALLLGLQAGGVIGALIALPLLSIVRETVLYLQRHLVLERWDKAPGPLL